jgi:hypothetical protein
MCHAFYGMLHGSCSYGAYYPVMDDRRLKAKKKKKPMHTISRRYQFSEENKERERECSGR